jgi:hypothetical protein
MGLGTRLYALSRRRLAVALSLLVATVACVCTLYRPSLAPPGLHARGLTIGSASSDLLIATPNLAVGGPADYVSLVNRAILVGNVMVSGPVLDFIAHELGIRADQIQGTAPMTANVPRTLIEPGGGANATAILQSPDHYKLEIQADPSVPILHVYGQAPSKAAAIRLTATAIQGVTSYLQRMQVTSNVPASDQIRVEQLGGVTGGNANPGSAMQIALLVFAGVFAVSLWVATIFAHVRRGWTAARLEHQLQL